MHAENKISLLLIEDEEFDVRRVKNTIRFFEQQIEISDIVSNGEDAIRKINEDRSRYDVIIMDYQIAGGLRGEELIHKIKDIDASLQIIVITKLTINMTDFNFAKNLMQAGAFWYCTKYPGDIEDYIYQPTDFLMSIFNAFDKKKLEMQSHKSNEKLIRNIEEILDQKRIVSVSPHMENLKRTIDKLAESDINTLIYGASGTGKEIVAYNIHYRSKRKFERFIPINCGGIPQELIESELFGYEKGAFTGANTSKAGLFELAHHGTIFLDEISELPLKAQVKLLRVIQDGEIEKIGRKQSLKVNVRVIAATNKDLIREVEEKRFREDLYYRLNVIPINILPLKDRQDDILVLFDYFLKYFSLEMSRPVPGIENGVLDIIKKYDWPGNVRELKNFTQRLVFHSVEVLTVKDIQNSLTMGNIKIGGDNKAMIDFSDTQNIEPLKYIEKRFRQKYFKFVRDNSDSDVEAATKLGLAPPNYHRMCKELGLK
ncbi:MAG: sigma-54 dependent transcriptional regulator [bacterium]